ncbi:hypothetical protein ACHAXH_000787 [Discostella pseudostelligera]
MPTSVMSKRPASTDLSVPKNSGDTEPAATDATDPPTTKKLRIYPQHAHCPSITASIIKALKWGASRELLAPFLNEEEKTSIHKLTRAQLCQLVDARVISGDITPQQFWAVVGTDRVRQQKKKDREKKKFQAPLDPIVAEALMKKNVLMVGMGSSPVSIQLQQQPPPPPPMAAAAASSLTMFAKAAASVPAASLPLPKPPLPYLPGMPPLRGPPTTSAITTAAHGSKPPSTTTTTTAAPTPAMNPPPVRRPPFMPLPRPQYKYILPAPPVTSKPIPTNFASTRRSSTNISNNETNTNNIPLGIVIGEPIPPNPFTPPSVSGTFHSSAILALGPDGKVIQSGKATAQMEYIYNKLIVTLSQLNATPSDILTMTVSVVDIEKNGKDVLAAHGKYMRNMDGAYCTPCAYSMNGVSGLMHRGCVVQMQVTVMVRRGLMANLMLDSGRSSIGRRPLPTPAPTAASAPAPPAAAPALPPAVAKKTSKKSAAAVNPETGKRGRGRPRKLM